MPGLRSGVKVPMASQCIDGIVKSLVTGNLGVGDFMQAVQRDIEEHEAAIRCSDAAENSLACAASSRR